MESDKRKKTRLDVARETWNSFLKFLYNGDEGTVLGRNGNSWSKILVFYLFYYGFLACLFAASVTIVLNSLDEYTPRYQTRLQTPGVAIQPKLRSNVKQTSDIIFSTEKDQKYYQYVDQIDTFLWQYAKENQTAEMGFHNCSDDTPPLANQEFSDGTYAKGCTFYKERVAPCATNPYGYDNGKPCIFVKVNRIINWFPVGFTNLSAAVGTESGAPKLSSVLEKYGQTYKPYLMYTTCFGKTDEDDQNLNGGETTSIKYYPESMGMPFTYYPYFGKKRQPGYVNPIVAVQFTNATTNVDIEVVCKVYALNLRDNKEMGEGFFGFKLNIQEKKKDD